MRTAPAPRLLVVAVLAVSLVACSKKVGDSCEIGSRFCLGKDTMLVCDTGRFVAQGCKGKGGCVEPPSAAPPICDFSGDQAGEPCFDHQAKTLCTPDETARISCYKGKLVVEPCRGPGGCMQLDNDVRCNRFTAREGDACLEDSEGFYACSEDKKTALQCKAGKYVNVRACASTCEIDVTNHNMVECH
jgi:hypothetical protein